MRFWHWNPAKNKTASVTPPPDLHSSGDEKTIPADKLAIHLKVVEKMGTGFLRCDNCNRVQDLSVQQVDLYMRKGWPVCCPGTANGGTMAYYRAEERKRG